MVKFLGGAGIKHDFAIGTGDAFQSAMGNSKDESDWSRRKRSLIRNKRQTNEFDMGTMQSNPGMPNGNSALDRMKDIFANVVDATKEMIQKMREVMNSKNGSSSNAETLQ